MGRMERVNQLIMQEISMIIQREMQDPRLRFVSITNADVSPDLHFAKINFSVLGNAEQVEEVEKTLNRASGFIRKLVSSRITLRNVPELDFVYDPSIEYGARIEETLKEIKEANHSDEGEI